MKVDGSSNRHLKVPTLKEMERVHCRKKEDIHMEIELFY